MSDFLMVLGQVLAQLIGAAFAIISLIVIVIAVMIARADEYLRRPKRK